MTEQFFTPTTSLPWYSLKPMEQDGVYYLNGVTSLEVGKEYTKLDKRTWKQKLLRKPRVEWEYLYFLDNTMYSGGHSSKVLVTKGTLYQKETWGISAAKIKVLEIFK